MFGGVGGGGGGGSQAYEFFVQRAVSTPQLVSWHNMFGMNCAVQSLSMVATPPASYRTPGLEFPKTAAEIAGKLPGKLGELLRELLR